MPRTQRQTIHYQRGELRLVQRATRPNLEITWWDRAASCQRYISAGTRSIEVGQRVLDDKYLEFTQGIECCPNCRRPYDVNRQMMALEAIEVYLASAQTKSSFKAISARLNHVVSYIETLRYPGVLIADVDENWIGSFRCWAENIPVVSPAGNVRRRALSTVENSVLQLGAAFRFVKEDPQFKTIQTKTLNRTPSYRASVDDLARMLRYALAPKKRRENLLAFLRISILTMARPDAVHDASSDPSRRQWDRQHAVFNLNPDKRRQTKKYRATVPIARQGIWLFESAPGPLVKGSAKKAMAAMAGKLGLPGEGEAGLKLIRRSVAHIVRTRLEAAEKPIDQLEVFLGHRVVGSVSELYAPFSPSYLQTVKGVLEGVLDELEALAPGAFLDTNSTRPDKVIPLRLA